jgi:hypothetical protein
MRIRGSGIVVVLAAVVCGFLNISAAELQAQRMTEVQTVSEPTIEEVQRVAIRYAEVEPEKIAKWRKQAAKKAWLPQVSFGLDRNSTDLWHWEGGSTTKTEDDILRKGRASVDWEVRLTWDLSELIWSTAQTSIDVRSRLMVQLRDDIIDEVTRIYFERLRVKAELEEGAFTTEAKRRERELRLQELTALLNGMTGGYFSESCKGKSKW